MQLISQDSHSSCDYGRSWGYDQRGIWVDNGCAATFRYGRGGGGHRGGDNAAAGVAAAIILGALISSAGDHHHNSDYRSDGGYDNGGYNNGGYNSRGGDYGVNVPAWAVGHFAGPDRDGGGPDIEIAVDPDGRINGMQGSSMFDGQMRGTSAWIGNREYTVIRSGNGIRLMGAGRSGYDLHRE